MQKNIYLMLPILFAICATCSASPYEHEFFVVNVPAGFKGPITQNLQGAWSIAFSKPHLQSQNATLLQITYMDFGAKIPKLNEKELSEGAEKYLLQFLAGVERRRTSFNKGSVQEVRISGIPGKKIEWAGNVPEAGISARGVMFCVIKGSRVFSFHTQDVTTFADKTLPVTIKAIESIRLK